MLLRNALSQTGWRGPVVDEDSWCRVLARQVRALNWTSVRADALPLLEDPRDDVLLDRRLVRNELRRVELVRLGGAIERYGPASSK